MNKSTSNGKFFRNKLNLISLKPYKLVCLKRIWILTCGSPILLMLWVVSCAPSRFVKPLDKKQSAVNLSVGGPLFKYGNDDIVMPMPFLSAAYAYGIDSSLTAFAGLNLTSGLYGNVQSDFGLLKQLVTQKGMFPSISSSLALNWIYRDRYNKRLFPQWDIYAYWEYGQKKNFFYTGIDNWFELAQNRGFDEKQEYHWFVSPLLGHVFNWEKWTFSTEFKFIAPNISNKSMVVDYVSPARDKGALGFYIGVTRKF